MIHKHMLRQTRNRPNMWKEKDVICTTSYFIVAVGTVQKTEENKTCERIQWKEGY